MLPAYSRGVHNLLLARPFPVHRGGRTLQKRTEGEQDGGTQGREAKEEIAKSASGPVTLRQGTASVAHFMPLWLSVAIALTASVNATPVMNPKTT